MGIKCITRLYVEQGKLLFAFLRLNNGNLKGQGQNILEVLAGKQIIPGLENRKTKEGYRDIEILIDDLVEQILNYSDGQCIESDEREKGVYYYYSIRPKSGRLHITIERRNAILYSGPLDAMPTED